MGAVQAWLQLKERGFARHLLLAHVMLAADTILILASATPAAPVSLLT